MTTGPSATVDSRRRLTTLLGSLLVALASGTNYVYSAYAPQLGRRLSINHTRLNVIALGGNMGVYSTGPLWGRLVDRRGPTLSLILAGLFLFAGYSGIRGVYDAGLPPAEEGQEEGSLPKWRFYALVLCGFLSGAGGNAGLTAAMNSTAKSFPDLTRATATGVVLSGFGLSAFFFSTLAHALFPGDTSEFLLLLALGTSLPALLGTLLVRPVPAPPAAHGHVHPHAAHDAHPDAHARDEEAAARLLGPTLDDEDESHDALASSIDDLHHHSHSRSVSAGHPHARPTYTPRESLELTDSARVALVRASSRAPLLRTPTLAAADSKPQVVLDEHGLPDVSGKALWSAPDFWLLFTAMSLLSGTGLMYINNVGSIAQALYASDPTYDERAAAQWQAAQVSTVSVANCAGRLLIGLTADTAKSRYGLHRVHCLPLVSFLFLMAQLAALSVWDVQHLWKASALLGLAYGSMFGLMPMICLEWFGMAHFSENWGTLSLSPMLGGNLFSLAFGRIYDARAHNTASSSSSSSSSSLVTRALELGKRAGLPPTQECAAGRACYAPALQLTAAACAVALGLSVWAGARDRKRIRAVEEAAARAQQVQAQQGGEVVWEAEDEDEER